MDHALRYVSSCFKKGENPVVRFIILFNSISLTNFRVCKDITKKSIFELIFLLVSVYMVLDFNFIGTLKRDLVM